MAFMASIACAIPKRCFIPPEKVLILCLLSADKPTASSSSFDFFFATSGKIVLNGKNIVGLNEKYRDLLGYLPQHFETIFIKAFSVVWYRKQKNVIL